MSRSTSSQFPKRIGLLFSLVLAGCWSAGVARAEEFLPTDFVSLLNGKDFTDWRFGDESAAPMVIPAAWRIEDGVIVGRGDAAAILASQWDYGDCEFEFDWSGGDDVDADLYVHAGRLLEADPIRITKSLAGRGPLDEHWKRDGLLWTLNGPGPSIVTKKKDFRNYQLRLAFLFAAPDPADINSGVYLRGVHPWQADIWEHKWGSGLWGVGHVSARMARIGDKQFYTELGKVIRPDVRMDNPAGQWNYLEVRVEDGVVSTSLNGRTTVDRYPVKEIDPKFPEAGGIGLQAHAPWKEVRFRGIRVKELPGQTQ